jgi:5-methylcytosine-specific restriction enzyme subunit McrC
MARPVTTLHEYETRSYSAIGEGSVTALEELVDRIDLPAFRFYRRHLQAQQYVGLIQLASHTFQLLPKIHGHGEDDLRYLLALLDYTGALPLHSVDEADLQAASGSFFELWIRHFARTLNRLLRRQYRRTYVEIEERAPFVRGKLRVKDMQSGRDHLTGRYPCRYEQFTADHLLYQVLKFCNAMLRREARHPTTRALLEENTALMADVTYRPVRPSDIDRIHLNRLNRDYEPMLQLCRLLLDNASLNLRAGRIAQLAFVFDMNRLFEAFIATILQRHKSQVRINGQWPLEEVRVQCRLGKLFGAFRMVVDIVLIDSAGHRILVDTKYKSLRESAHHAGLSQSDFYQMYAYATAGDVEYDHVILLYPEVDPLRRRYDTSSVSLHVRTLDLREFVAPGAAQVDAAGAITQIEQALTIGPLSAQ